MLKGKHINILLMLLLVVAFSATQAMAAAPSTSCTFVAGTTTYTLTTVPAPDGSFPMVVSGTTGTQYLWAYQLTSSSGGLNGVGAMDGLVPVCDPDMGYAPVGGGQLLIPGKGDSSNNYYGLGDSNNYVMSMNAQSTSSSYGGYNLPAGAYIFLSTRAGNLQNTPMAVKIGTKTYYCSTGTIMTGIVGPACVPPAEIGATGMKRIDVDAEAHPGEFFTAVYGPNGRVKYILDKNGNQVPPVPSSDDPLLQMGLTYIPDGTLLKFGDNSEYYYPVGYYYECCALGCAWNTCRCGANQCGAPHP